MMNGQSVLLVNIKTQLASASASEQSRVLVILWQNWRKALKLGKAEMEQQQALRQKKGWKRAARRRGAGSRRRSSIIEDVVAQLLATGGVPPLQIPGGEQDEEEGGRSGSCPPPVLRAGANLEVKEMSERRGGENWNEEEMLEEVPPRFGF